MRSTILYGWAEAKKAKDIGAINDSDLPQYKNRIIIYRNGPAERGHPRGICTINADPIAAQWLVDRLSIAEKHEPWPSVVPYSKKY